MAMVMCSVKDETCLSNTSFMQSKIKNKLRTLGLSCQDVYIKAFTFDILLGNNSQHQNASFMIRTFNKYALILVMQLYVFNHNAFGHCYDYIATA